MSTPAPTLDDCPTDLRDTVAAFAAGFLPTITSRDQITPETVSDALAREARRVAVLANDRRNPTRDAMVATLSGTYDEFHARA